jgi:hypothetical protein
MPQHKPVLDRYKVEGIDAKGKKKKRWVGLQM